MLTLRSLTESVRQELGRDPARSSAEELVNEAGAAWVDAHEWQYLRARSLTIDLVPTESRYALPDYVEDVATSLDRPNSVWTPIPIYDFPTFSSEKERYLASIGREFQPIATSYFATQGSDNAYRLFIEIFPAGVTETVSLDYTAGWKPLNKSSDTADVPLPLQRAFREWVRRYASGREKQPQMNIDTMHQTFFSGPVGMNAMKKDGMVSGALTPRAAASGMYFGKRKLIAGGGTTNSGFYDRYRWYSAPR